MFKIKNIAAVRILIQVLVLLKISSVIGFSLYNIAFSNKTRLLNEEQDLEVIYFFVYNSLIALFQNIQRFESTPVFVDKHVIELLQMVYKS